MKARIAATALAAGCAVATAAALALESDANALPTCARPSRSIAQPGLLPRSFPFPEGTVFTERFQNRASHGAPAAAGRIPLDLAELADFLTGDLQRAGYTVDLVRNDPREEVLALYSVRGFSGKFHARPLPGCAGASDFSVTARPELLGRNGAVQ